MSYRRTKIPMSKQSIYIPEPMRSELAAESKRLDRPLSWLLQRCVMVGMPYIRSLPTVSEAEAAE